MQLVQNLLNRLPQPLRDRLMAWRVLFPNTPLKDLSPAVKEEVTQILTSTLPQNPPDSSPQPPLGNSGLRHPLLPPPAVVERLKALQSAYPHTPRPAPTSAIAQLSTIIGTDTHTGREISITQQAKQQGVYLIGANGTGKTSLLKTMIAADVHNGLGLCVIEPHGDLTNDILGLIPRHRLNDVVYLDVEDFEFPFGLNLFEVPEQSTIKTQAAASSFVSHTFETVWQNSGFDTPRLMSNLRSVTRTLFANPGSTFAEIPLLYSNEAVRARMLSQVTNPPILQFWEEYERMPPRERRQFTESTLNRVTAFLDEPMICNILAQAKTTIDFRYLMDNAKILLIKLSPQFEEASRLIGTVIIGKLLMTAFSRSDTPEERRQPFNLYVDEFQRFQSSDFATLISEARKFNISTCQANQLLTQLLEQNRASALGAGTIICFRVSGEDSRVLARSFDTKPTQPHIVGEEPVRAPVADIVGHLVRRGHTNPAVSAFTKDYLMPFETFLQQVRNYPHPFVFGCAECRTGHLLECRRLLNDALFEAMQTGRADGPVHPWALLALSGAANDGSSAVLRPHKKETLFSGARFLGFEDSAFALGEAGFLERQQAVDRLVKKYARERWWDTLSESRIVYPGPAFVRLLRALRSVLGILAAEPVMVDTGQYRPRLQPRLYSDVEGEISNYLANQENYHAKVKIVSSGEYTIKTKPAVQSLTGEALTERIEAVKRQCRALGYTRHYTEVIEEIRKRQERWRGNTGSEKPQPPDGTDRPQEPPPPALF
jgi:hypothetical protein